MVMELQPTDLLKASMHLTLHTASFT